jgi:hypothetical protein
VCADVFVEVRAVDAAITCLRADLCDADATLALAHGAKAAALQAAASATLKLARAAAESKTAHAKWFDACEAFAGAEEAALPHVHDHFTTSQWLQDDCCACHDVGEACLVTPRLAPVPTRHCSSPTATSPLARPTLACAGFASLDRRAKCSVREWDPSLTSPTITTTY